MDDSLQVLAMAVAGALGAGLLGLLAAWTVRGASIAWQLVVVAVVPVLGVLAGVLVVARAMFISEQDVGALTLVAASSAAVSVLVAVLLSRAVVRWSRALAEDVRRMGEPTAYDAPARRGPAEFRRLSEELATTHRRLAEAREQQLRLEESRRELVSWVSHDLRTPLAGMRAMAEALEDGMAPDPERYHRRIRVEVDRVSGLVDDLFELSRIHAGVLRLEPGTGLLADLVGEVLAAAEPGARSGGVVLASSVEPGLEVHADPVALGRVLENLVGNAVRHTPAGGRVEVAGELWQGQVCIRVSDGCGGLAEEELARVLEVGWQAGGARTPSAQPLARRGGLGLAIVAGLVEAHGGSVRAENQPAGPGGVVPGCRFVVALPHGSSH